MLVSIAAAMIVLPAIVLSVLTGFAPVIETYVTSFIVKLANTGKGFLAGKSDLVVRLALGVVGVVVSYGGNLLHVVVSGDPMQWGFATAQGIVQALIAHGIYALGQNKPPA